MKVFNSSGSRTSAAILAASRTSVGCLPGRKWSQIFASLEAMEPWGLLSAVEDDMAGGVSAVGLRGGGWRRWMAAVCCSGGWWQCQCAAAVDGGSGSDVCRKEGFPQRGGGMLSLCALAWILLDCLLQTLVRIPQSLKSSLLEHPCFWP